MSEVCYVLKNIKKLVKKLICQNNYVKTKNYSQIILILKEKQQQNEKKSKKNKPEKKKKKKSKWRFNEYKNREEKKSG